MEDALPGLEAHFQSRERGSAGGGGRFQAIFLTQYSSTDGADRGRPDHVFGVFLSNHAVLI